MAGKIEPYFSREVFELGLLETVVELKSSYTRKHISKVPKISNKKLERGVSAARRWIPLQGALAALDAAAAGGGGERWGGERWGGERWGGER
jgi:hypothetical protein